MDEPPAARWSTWRTIVAFGLVSLAADMVYEGMRSVAGPYLASLGASALAVGAVTGAGEAIALGLRLLTGPYADRSGRPWRLTVVGYALTAVGVPLLALAPFVGVAGVYLGSALVLAERTGKAVRSPAKSALLADLSAPVGRGRGFAVHKALDQVGAFAGPLLVAGVAALTGHLWVAFAALAVPGAASLVQLARLGRAGGEELIGPRAVARSVRGPSLPARFHLFALACAGLAIGLGTFGVIAVHLTAAGLVPLAAVPIVYAGAMLAEAVAALATGVVYDRLGGCVLLVLPVAAAAVPALVFGGRLAPVLLGIGLWGLVTGVQDSTVKALVADLVPAARRATAYGVFAAYQGVGALAGGLLAGGLAAGHLPLLIAVVVLAEVGAVGALAVTLRRRRSQRRRDG